jgi:hypothetical protein
MEVLPLDLVDLLSNTITRDNIIDYLPLASRFALSQTCKSYKNLVLGSSDAFRLADLSRCRGAYIPYISRVDSGGQSFRAERMDESLTEDEFYAGPLRGVLGRMRRHALLQQVNSLVLDGLASVTNDLLHELVTSPEYHIRLLSIRKCPNVNQSKLQQLLAYICRPGRPENTPRLRGIYFFTHPTTGKAIDGHHGVTALDGAQLGALPTNKVAFDGGDSYYAPSGRLIRVKDPEATFWAQTIASCKGLIWFDAVLCSHMHTEMAAVVIENIRDDRPSTAIATIALGPGGCTGCGKAPPGAPVWRSSAHDEFPLLWPPPSSGTIVDAIRPPYTKSSNGKDQRLIVSCQWCVDGRHCDSCHRWWCSDCYNPTKGKHVVEEIHNPIDVPSPSDTPVAATTTGTSIKVHDGFCVEHCLRGELMAGAGAGGMWA